MSRPSARDIRLTPAGQRVVIAVQAQRIDYLEQELVRRDALIVRLKNALEEALSNAPKVQA